jgi:arginyl-tRNA synthetase
MARTLRHAGNNVQVQNYIDNTGVQVADVVIGFLYMEKRTPVTVKTLAMEPRFDYYCWDLYAKATQFFAEDKERAAKLRGETLKAIEEGRGEEAEVGQVVADAVVSCGPWRGWGFFMSCWRARARFCIYIFGIWRLRN